MLGETNSVERSHSKSVTSAHNFTRLINQRVKKYRRNVTLTIYRCQELFFMLPADFLLPRLLVASDVERLLTPHSGPLTMRAWPIMGRLAPLIMEVQDDRLYPLGAVHRSAPRSLGLQPCSGPGAQAWRHPEGGMGSRRHRARPLSLSWRSGLAHCR